MNNTYYVFRQPESSDELLGLFRLRYNVLRTSRNRNLCVQNSLDIDLDCYDLKALHFGLYEVSTTGSQPLGYVRIVTGEDAPFTSEILSLANLDSALQERVCETPKVMLPVLKNFPQKTDIEKFCEELTQRGRSVAEVGRLSLDKKCRGLETAKFFVMAICAACRRHGIVDALVTCCERSECFYESFGFSRLDGTTAHRCYGFDYSLVCLYGAQENIPALKQARVLKMAHVYAETGSICYCPDNPDEYYPPTESRSVITAVAA